MEKQAKYSYKEVLQEIWPVFSINIGLNVKLLVSDCVSRGTSGHMCILGLKALKPEKKGKVLCLLIPTTLA